MFRGNELTDLVRLFDDRQVSLFHSCEFVDFQSYVQAGGIPSRKLLETVGLPFTRFKTDRNDQDNVVWDKVFFNPLDFGEIFAFGKAGVPTVYGPIAFVVRPEALLYAEDVAICLRSAGNEGFRREDESLKSIHDVDRLFFYDRHQEFPYSAKVKIADNLRKEFQRDYVSNPEISCTYRQSKAPVEFTSYLLVDPYIINGKSLKSIVVEWLARRQICIEARERPCKKTRLRMYNELVSILADGIPTLQQIAGSKIASRDLQEWAKSTRAKGLDKQWLHYALYLREGTLLPLLGHS
jgi:hypothetical protein